MKVILFVALPNEFPEELLPDGIELHYTGVGKINSAIKCTEVLKGLNPNETIVLNYGSAGSNLPINHIYKCVNFIQGDMDAEPFAPKTNTPFDKLIYKNIESEITFPGSGYVCVTQDKFENNPEKDFIYDMEAYSIAKYCKLNGFYFASFKFISDNGNSEDWKENHNKGIQSFCELIVSLISSLPKNINPDGEMVDTPVLGTGAEKRESSSLSWGTTNKFKNIKQFIVTYNNSYQINKCLNSIFTNLSQEELSITEFYIINNHSNLKLDLIYKDRVKVLNNSLRPDFSTGHLSRNWNQAIINGFKNLDNPDCSILITNQDDVVFKQNYIKNLIKIHKNYDLVQFGAGDSFVSYTPNAVKNIGMWDERFCNIGYQEADYFLRGLLNCSNLVSFNDNQHNRFFNQIKNSIVEESLSGFHRNEKSHLDSMKFHSITYKLFKEKWGKIEPDEWDTKKILNSNLKPLIKSYVLYPYFENKITNI